jgi:hypothetical protein
MRHGARSCGISATWYLPQEFEAEVGPMKYTIYEDPRTHEFALLRLLSQFVEDDADCRNRPVVR